MKRVRQNDYYAIHRVGLFSYIDVKLLVDLYLPLIGSNALAIYLRLQEDPSGKENTVSAHKGLFDALRLSAGEFESAMNALEAVGLVKSFLSVGAQASYFVYRLFSPLSPEKFFDDPLLAGTFLKYVGAEKSNEIKARYSESDSVEGMEDVSTTFEQQFSPDLNEPYYALSTKNMKGRKYGKANTSFDRAAFDKALLDLGVGEGRLSDKDKERIEKTAVLYGIAESVAAEFALECLVNDGINAYFDERRFTEKMIAIAPFGYLRQEAGEKSQVSSETSLAKKIRLMDETSPSQYLGIKQGNHRPAPADLRLLSRLAFDYGLPNGVINVLLDYVLEKNDNILSAAYTEKVAGALAREGVRSARDAMEYFNRVSSKKKKVAFAKDEKPKPSLPPKETKKEEVAIREENDGFDEDIEAFLKELALVERNENKDD